jgi:hypothetical protein
MPFPSVRRCAAQLMLALLFVGSITLPAAYAETDKLNGNWVLDAEQSESYKDAVRVAKDQIMKQHKRRKQQQLRASGGTSTTGNKYFEQEQRSRQVDARDTVDVDWSLPVQLQTVMEAKTLKIYQARMCAMLYDKKLKRLFAINPDGKSYSAKGEDFAQRDDIGSTVGYFEGQTLVIDTDIKGGDRLLERIKLDESSDQLVVETRYRRTDLARTLQYKRVFRRGE